MTNLISPIRNFDDIGYAILCVFSLFMGDDWHLKAAIYIRAGSEQGTFAMSLAYGFFLFILVAGHVILQALLTALLLKNFEQSLAEESEDLLEQERLALINGSDDLEDDLIDDEEEEKFTCDKCKNHLEKIKEMFDRTFSGNLVAYERD